MTNRSACILLAAATLSACTPTISSRGNMLEDYQLEEIQPGQHSRTDVLRVLGSPTTVSPFDRDIWYYIGQTTEKSGIFDPEVTDERIVIVRFGENGLLREAREIDNKRLDIPLAKQETPTHGNDITILQQFLGNLGRFNPQEND